MTTSNDITCDLIVSKSSEAYRDNYDSIFRKKQDLPSYITRTETHVTDTRVVEVQPDGSALMVDPRVKVAYNVSTGKEVKQCCTRSHPHENMSKECKELTVVARENHLKRIQEFWGINEVS